MEVKETYTEVLIRLDERVKNLIEINGCQHKEIIDSIHCLKGHVNDENEKMDKRITEIERLRLEESAVRKDNDKRSKRNGMMVYYVVIPIVSAVIGVLVYLLI